MADLRGHIELLLPFPSASWSTSARPESVAKAAGRDAHLRSRLPMAYAPKDLHDFGRYAAETVRHYRQLKTSSIRKHALLPLYVQVLNEPIYADYALPRKLGDSVDDYVKLLQVAHNAMKQVDPQVQIVGGISAGLTSAYTHEFITKGGLKAAKSFDLMGNIIGVRTLELTQTPVYVVAHAPEPVLRTLGVELRGDFVPAA